jgi:vancomycin resistance protein VanW
VNDLTRKFTLTIIAATLITTGFVNSKAISRVTGLTPVSGFPQKDLQNTGASVQALDSSHPYGRAFEGVLMWENDRGFHEFCAKHQTSVRMSAFQTTLPDPLPGEEYNVALAADYLTGKVIYPGAVFSVNATAGPYIKERGFRDGPTYMGTQVIKTIGGGVCKIASTLYNVATLANLKIIERYPHGMQVPYVPPGQDATVSYGNKDLKFINTTREPVILWADTNENTLYMAIYGRTKPPKVTWHHKILHRQITRTIYRCNRKLKPGEEKVVVPGADGLTVKSWLTIQYPDGRIVKKEMGIDYYRPLPNVVERGKI